VQPSRRKFLIQSAGFAAGLEIDRVQKAARSINNSLFVDNAYPNVCAARGSSSDSMAAILKTSLDGLGGIERFVKPGQVVAIKPNATWAYPPHTASSTDPELIEAIVALVREAGAKRVIVMDHCSIDPGTAESLRVSGIGKMVDKLGVEKIFPDRFNAPKSVYTAIDIPSGKAFQKLGVIKAAVEADVRINLAVAKTHNVTKMTMTLKHMMGFLEMPGLMHAKLEQGIADLNTPSAVKAQLNILEAVRVRLPSGPERVCAGPETDLTHPDRIKRMNQIVSGTDPVLIDAYGCERFFQVKPEELTHLVRAVETGVGEMDVQTAIKERRLVERVVGQPLLRTTASPTPTNRPVELVSTPTGKPMNPLTANSTPTPLPTATAANNERTIHVAVPQISIHPGGATPNPGLVTASENCGVGAYSSTGVQRCGGAVNPNPFLSGVLLPLAAVVLGVGMVIMRRIKQQDKSPGKEQDDHSE
jgi:uncharacterized protein (DUF362 family)